MLDLDNLVEAVQLARAALAAREARLGAEHPDTLASVVCLAQVLAAASNLASFLQDQGMWDEAETLHHRALRGFEKRHGSEHPNTLAVMTNLAAMLEAQGKYGAAE